ncbi:penicillin-binding protein 1C [Pseudofulvimonas gallinarii]|jgi:penicillin-binding protein 1C|uniref:peptidoglycan glycosyltransferase n=1 Tax=Pseudofulvimonas gallinarii TaxID=634155 RepID=A0A4S3KW83_9GAMM|nr:penicillin-binding protein 1C [Pseudofulvimonas gallinarii]TCT00079.1 penicillin-binding protein 1C [Pseudofulvimonas gallinarii]THD13553.1 penicillin-binding protein 1C [Pseudofulvimonas gallinarii]
MRFPSRRWARFLRTTLLCLAVVALVLLALDRLWPPLLPDAGHGTVVVAADGRPLRAFADERGVWRRPVAVDEVSPLYIEALLAYEDGRFWWHPGIDPVALARAAWQTLRHGRIVSGGSTLTMQVARILQPPGRRHSVAGKIRQAFRALQLEWRLDKKDILALYLDHAPFGGPIEGVAAASWAYLGKPPDQLSHAEAALLAVLPQAPSRNRPDRHPGRARRERDKVLQRMADSGVWAADVVAAAMQEPVTSRRLRAPADAALFAERLRSAHPRQAQIATLIDADLQATLEARVSGWLERFPPSTSAAVLVVENHSLAVRAYVGSGAWGDPQRLGHVDMVRARRSPGSTLKPLLFGIAVDDGLIHSGSLLVDAPQSFAGYRPANFDTGFRGPVSAAEALRLSLNVPAVDLLDRVGPSRFAARLQHAGLRLHLPRGAEPNLSMILGGVSTSLEDLVAAYSALGNGGLAGRPRLTADQPVVQRRLMSAGAAFIVREMLTEPAPPGSAAEQLARADRLVAKTGTSWGYRDAWAVGVLPGWTLGVWIGRPDGTPMPGHYGAVSALPLLQSIGNDLPRRATAFGRPDSVRQVDVCWPLGQLAAGSEPETCPQRRSAWILDDVVPPTLPDRSAPNAQRRIQVQVDGRGERRDTACANGQALTTRTIARWPQRLLPWLEASARNAATPPPWSPACPGRPAHLAQALEITGLREGMTLRPAPGSRDSTARVKVTAQGSGADIWWLVDDRLAAHNGPGESTTLAFAEAGPHRVVAVDGNGNHAAVRVRVLPASGDRAADAQEPP